ncbi:MAG: beta-ketoacyl-[acyl-carrier-protein] synthase II, partial [Clostridia bacterium]|nr:beta-ketoacyl-[acyl-carrier-protein] synthase II [Clostridia bacterium]
MKKRVAITGIGVISPVGIGKDSFWEALKAGRSGIGPVTRFATDGFPTRIAGEVKGFDPAAYMDKRDIKRMDRFAQYAVAASKMAVADAGLDLEKEERERIGVVLGTGIGGTETFEEQHQILLERGPGRISPFFIPMMIANMGAAQIAIQLGLGGLNYTVV